MVCHMRGLLLQFRGPLWQLWYDLGTLVQGVLAALESYMTLAQSFG